MFDTLTDKFSDLFRSISGRGKISEENIRDAMKNVRTALLEADVNFQVVKDFCENVIQKAIGSEVIKSLRPDELMVKIVHDELAALMGPVDSNLYYVSPGPTVIMLAGLQGSGKTTTCGKLAKYLINNDKKPLLTAVDLQRPAAIEQLKTLGRQLDVPVYSREDTKDAVAVCREAVQFARNNNHDVVILDTAGRLHIDTELMTELSNICKAVNPHQIFLVCDAM
ncbi:MAG: signal recognition particle receptor subunit alpha, partial [Sedimentisphaerales bacterium]|nr:signal recognition particle receptor subunit alpha [Sedimentisphaerales bacterium]